jgi:hypothetical protein
VSTRKKPTLEAKGTAENQDFPLVPKKGVSLTKDNLAKRNWQGSIKCCFLCSVEIIQHLFFNCHFASFVWNVVHIKFGIQPPTTFFYYVWLLAK